MPSMRSAALAAWIALAAGFATQGAPRAQTAGPPDQGTASQAPSPEAAAPAAAVTPPASGAPPADAASKADEPDAKGSRAKGSGAKESDEAALRAMVRTEAERAGMPAEIAEAVADVESGYNARAVGGVGEIGLMQILPSTARMLGFSEPLPRLFDPEVNVRYGVRYLGQAWRLTGEDICGTVMKYRAGHGETRFSQKSVAYCVRVREILAARGFKVTGAVPVATFGAAAGRLGPAGGVRRLANGRVRMRFNWKAVDVRRKALDRAASAGVSIMQ